MKYILYLIFFAEIATAQKLPDLIPYRKGDKWGYADSTGKIIIQPIYNGVDTMHNGVLIAHGADKITYLLDSKGKILFGREKFAIMYVKYDRDSLLYLMDYTKEDPNHDINNEYYGYLSLKGQIVVPPKYHSMRAYHEGLAAVEKDDKWGFIDRKGNEIVKPKYLLVRDFNEGYAKVESMAGYGYKSCHEGLINSKGEVVLPCNNENVSGCSRGYIYYEDCHGVEKRLDKNLNEVPVCPTIKGMVANPCWPHGKYPCEINGKMGFCTETGQPVIPAVYDKVDTFHEGFAKVLKINPNHDLISPSGLINTRGKLILPIEFASISEAGIGFFQVRTLEGLNGLVDSNGKYLVPPGNYRFGQVSEGLIAITRSNNRCGYINTKGDTIIPFNYAGGYDVQGGLIRYSLLGKMGFMDKKGNKIIPPVYKSIREFRKGIAKVEDNGKEFFIDKYGRVYYEP